MSSNFPFTPQSEDLQSALPRKSPCKVSSISERTVLRGRGEIQSIISGRDDRFLVIVGPDSIQDRQSIVAFGRQLEGQRSLLKDRLCIVMQVPPSAKDLSEKERRVRLQILCKITRKGLPVATQFNDVSSTEHVRDLISCGSLSAVTLDRKKHREISSKLSMPLTFENCPGEAIDIALNALFEPRAFPGCMVLRGGELGPNHYTSSVSFATRMMRGKGIVPSILIDSSYKDVEGEHPSQIEILRSAVYQRNQGNKAIKGVVLEVGYSRKMMAEVLHELHSTYMM